MLAGGFVVQKIPCPGLGTREAGIRETPDEPSFLVEAPACRQLGSLANNVEWARKSAAKFYR